MNEIRRTLNGSHYVVFIVSSLIVIHALLLGWGAYIHSPTLNEPAHLVAGISNWQFGRFDLYKVNPPLVRMVAAAPVLLARPKTEWRHFYEGPRASPQYILGEDFVAANGKRTLSLVTLARWTCIPFSLLGGWVCFRWARELYGARAGLFAATLWCFCPNILAHGQVITSDMAATAFAITACFTFWLWLRQPSWWNTLLSGIALSLAELSKTTLLLFNLLWPLMWVIYRGRYRRNWLRELGMHAARTLLALYIVNMAYGFEGTGIPLGQFRFVSSALGSEQGSEKAPPEGGNRFAKSWLGHIPVPLPKNYLLGIDTQKLEFENYSHLSYLRGTFSERGWWYYYCYALAIKVPLGTWLLIGLAATCGAWISCDRSQSTSQHVLSSQFDQNNVQDQQQSKRNVQAELLKAYTLRDEVILLSPAIVFLLFVSAQSGFSHHMRYVLPLFPFVFVWISRLATVRHSVLANATGIALTWSIASSMSTYPHNLSYFNEVVGGPRNGAAHLIHSNIDWGQDLLILQNWLDAHPEAQPLRLAYCGFFDPRHIGLEFVAPDEMIPGSGAKQEVVIPAGWYAISVNFVRGFPFSTYKGDGTKVYLKQNALAAFQHLKPVAMAGYSIYIYHVTE